MFAAIGKAWYFMLAPEIIEVVEDEEEVEETVIESTETTQEEIIEEVEVMEEELDVDVPFAIIEDVPLFPGCERVKKSERRFGGRCGGNYK